MFDRAIKKVSGVGNLLNTRSDLYFTKRQLWYEMNRRLRYRTWGPVGLYVLRLLRRPAGSPRYAFNHFEEDLRRWVSTHGALTHLVDPKRLAIPAKRPKLVDLNTATQQELETLPGIYSSRARRIIEYREQGHVFHKPEEILAIPRIGFAIDLDSLRSRLVFPEPQIEEREGSKQGETSASRYEQPQVERDPDLTQYSFDRVLVVDDQQIATMLIANYFHFENNCAILSVDGYPEDVFDDVMTMLRRNENLTVFTLHDASIEGCALPLTLRQDDWFPDLSINVIDLGMRPQHIRKMRVFTLRGERITVPESLRNTLPVADVKWLARGDRGEIAVMRPDRLMRAIYRGFAMANAGDAVELRDGEVGSTGGARSADASLATFAIMSTMDGGHADVYASDSFG